MTELKNMMGRARMIEGNDQVRAQKCSQEINVILQKYDCDMLPALTIAGGNIDHRVLVQVKKAKNGNGGRGN